jgi:hypothetical protein
MFKIDDCIKLYNHLSVYVIRRCGKQFALLSIGKKENREQAQKIIDELSGTDINIGSYIVGCFSKHNWRFKPKFDKLLGPSYREYFFDNRTEVWEWWRIIKRELYSDVIVKKPIGKEILKQRYISEGKPDLCYLNRDLTGGYNVESSICRECSWRGRCSESVRVR